MNQRDKMMAACDFLDDARRNLLAAECVLPAMYTIKNNETEEIIARMQTDILSLIEILEHDAAEIK